MNELEDAIYKNNISLLKKKHPDAWQALMKGQKTPSQTIELISANDKPNLLIKKNENETLLIHNGENPGSESASFLSMVKENSTGIVLIFGMGLGYLALDLIKQRQKLQYIIIFELEIEFFSLAMKHIDLASLLDDRRVILFIGRVENVDQLLSPFKRSFMLEDIYTHKSIPCFQVNTDYEKLSSAVFDFVSTLNIEGATQSIGGRVFVENRLKHLTSIHHDHLLEELSGKFQGYPSLIIAAGPSLDRNIREIKKAKGKAIIIAADTALPSLLNHDIVPDFVTSIDFNAPTYEKIADTALDHRIRDINLICTSWVATSVSKTFPAKTIFWAFGDNALESWIRSSIGGTMAIAGAGTVAHLNFLTAKTLGCDPVIFVGQDLAYSYSKEHASDVVFTGTQPIAKILEHAVWVKGVNEPNVPTTREMHGFRILFEQWIKNSDGRVVNATEGGAWIEGAEHMTLSEAIDLFCNEDVSMNLPFETKKKDPSKAMESMLEKVEQAEKVVKIADMLAGSVLKEIKKLQDKKKKVASLDSLSPKLRNQIIKLDTAYQNADRDSLWEIFNEMTMEGLRQNEREKFEIDRLEGVPGKYLEWLAKSIKRTDRVNRIRKENLDFIKTRINDLLSFYANEKKILSRMEENGRIALPDVHSLAESYFQNEDYVLLDQFLSLQKEESAAIYYYQGIIALHRREYGKAEQCLKISIAMDGTYHERIITKRKEMANYYYNWALTVPFDSLIDLESRNGFHMRLKGLKCLPNDERLMDEFRMLVQKDLKKVLKNTQQGQEEETPTSKELLKAWIDLLIKEEEVQHCIPEDDKSLIFRHYGKLLLEGKEFENALENFKNALSLMPQRPDLYIALTDLCFSMNEFDEGIKYLRIAVSLDSNYAAYWKNMGDNLKASGDYQGAVISYENYYSALPGKIEAIEMIGDCYLKMGDTEAAEEARRQFERLQRNSG